MFGNPGTVEQGFLDVLGDVGGTDYVLALHEGVAVGMADGYARATGGPALVQLHTGVGLGNGVGMLYQALRGHSPLVVVAGEAGVRYDALDAQMAADLVGMARPVTKYATRVLHPSSVLRVLRRAVRIAMTPPRGPVFVALPMDVLDAPTTEPVLPTGLPSMRSVPAPDLVAEAAALLAGAERPLILYGDGVAVSGAQRELAEVAELLGADAWGVDSSELNLDFLHPLARGQLGHMFGSDSAAVVAGADAVLVVGTYLFPEVFPELDDPFLPGARVVHVDADGAQVAKNFPVTLGLVADPKPTLAALAAQLRSVQDGPVRSAAADRLAGRAAEAEQGRAALLAAPDEAVFPAFVRRLAERTGDELAVFDEALTSSPTLTSLAPPRLPGRFFQTRGGSLGVGIPGALGVKLALPKWTVVGFTGDGGSMYTVQALWTAARYGIGAKLVICNNRRYRLLDLNIGRYRADAGTEPRPMPDAFDLSGPDIAFTDLAASLGVPAARVEKADQVDAVLDRMLGEDGPFLVDIDTA
jgi:benzoylformate decarboxylase